MLSQFIWPIICPCESVRSGLVNRNTNEDVSVQQQTCQSCCGVIFLITCVIYVMQWRQSAEQMWLDRQKNSSQRLSNQQKTRISGLREVLLYFHQLLRLGALVFLSFSATVDVTLGFYCKCVRLCVSVFVRAARSAANKNIVKLEDVL